MSYVALKGMIRRIHPDAGDILPTMPSSSYDSLDKQEAIRNIMSYLHPDFQMEIDAEKSFKPREDIEEADPYGGSMISPYDDEPSDDDMNRAYDEAEYYITTEHPIDGDDPDQIANLKHDTERYLEMIGYGDMVSEESIDQIIKNIYPTTELDDLKTDLAKDPALKARFGKKPKDVIDKYKKREK